MSEILTLDELRELSGYKQPALIARWLKANKIPFLLSITGLPKVHRFALAQKMGVKKVTQDDQENQEVKPKFDKIK